ncbi:MAG TPA: hypothetical protein VFJ23_05760 [Candidatus Nitrosotalea sp.]|nr:hypothetical protein [Candidatus Nitrosotalea sp.]
MKVENLLQAKMIAIKFLEQYNSSVTFRSATLEGEIWIVILDVGMMNARPRKVLVDRSTGNIVSYSED